MESSLAEKVAKWEKFWRDYLHSVTEIVTPSNEDEAWMLINQRGDELIASAKEAKQSLRGTLCDPDLTPTLTGSHGIFTTPEQAEPLYPRQIVSLDTYYKSLKLYEIWQEEISRQGSRSCVQLAIDIQKSWGRFYKEAEPVLIYNLLTLLGRHEDAYAFAAAVKAPAYIKAGSRTDIAMKREAAGRMERGSIQDVLRGDLPGTVASLPHNTFVDGEVEGVPLRFHLTRPLLPTTPEGLNDFRLGVKQKDAQGKEARRSPVGLVVDLVGLPEKPLPPEFNLDEKPGLLLEDPLQAMLLDETESDADENVERILRAITALPEKQQAAFKMKLLGRTYSEIAEKMSITPEGVKTNLAEAKKNLRKKLG